VSGKRTSAIAKLNEVPLLIIDLCEAVDYVELASISLCVCL